MSILMMLKKCCCNPPVTPIACGGTVDVTVNYKNFIEYCTDTYLGGPNRWTHVHAFAYEFTHTFEGIELTDEGTYCVGRKAYYLAFGPVFKTGILENPDCSLTGCGGATYIPNPTCALGGGTYTEYTRVEKMRVDMEVILTETTEGYEVAYNLRICQGEDMRFEDGEWVDRFIEFPPSQTECIAYPVVAYAVANVTDLGPIAMNAGDPDDAEATITSVAFHPPSSG